MLAIILLMFNAIVSILGIYLFDYRLDNAIDNPLVITLSILIGFVSMVILLWLYIEIFYILIAKRKPQNSMTKHYFMKQMMSLPLILTNTRIKVIGLQNLPDNPGFSIYSNHTSMMDPPVLMYKLKKYPVSFLAKEVTGRLFAIGKWTRETGCVMIDRCNVRKSSEAVSSVVQNINNGLTMVIFPEGTRSKKIGHTNPFKAGSFRIALNSMTPLVPVTIKKPKNFKKVLWPFPKKVELIIHKPILFEEYSLMNTNELSEHVKAIIESSL